MPKVLRNIFLVIFSKLSEEDKRLHMVWSFWLTITAQILWPAPWAFFAVFSLGFIKECWDYRFGSGFCLFDIMGNLIGITAALTLTRILPSGVFE